MAASTMEVFFTEWRNKLARVNGAQTCGHLVIDSNGCCNNCFKYTGPEGGEPEDEFLRRTR